MTQVIQLVGKWIGIISGAGSCVCWTIAMWKPLPVFPLTGVAFIVALLMALFAILAVIAAVHGHGIMLIVLFFLSFLPIGLYLLGDPDWIQLIGILNFGYLIAGGLIWAVSYAEESLRAPDV